MKFVVALICVTLPVFAHAQNESPAQTLFTNVSIFNGTDNRLYEGHSVLVEGNLIKSISDSAITPGTNTTVIDGGGRTLMPGLIDSHVHFYLSMGGGRPGMEASRWDYFPAMGAAAAQEWIADGFTTVRDMGGMHDGLRNVIDAGMLDGPRMYLAAGMVTQSSGHGDMLPDGQNNPEHSNLVKLGITLIADGEDEVRKAVRQNFSRGANITKIMIGGGVAGAKGPLWAGQYTDAEILAAVEESAAREVYVSAHVYQDEHIKRALELGVRGIEHGQFISEETAELMKAKGAFISPYVASVVSDEIFKHPVFGNEASFEYARTMDMKEGTRNFVSVIKKVKPLIVFSSDIVSTNGMAARQHRDFEKFVFAEAFGNFEALVAMTSAGGEVAAMTGRSNPYPHGKLGVIEVGAYADILLVDGNPLEDISVIGGNPEWFTAPPRECGIETIRLIMKDGIIYKNTL
ncbi:MAG: amidohydrolase family protein [Woeseiaceae bacterium]